MKIAVFGILPFSDLIKEGFKSLGHEISNKNPDLIFSNDPAGYQDAVFLKDMYPKTHLILNVLDIPWHFKNITQQFKILVDRFFTRANSITAISQKTKKDLIQFFDKDAYDKIKVIYNPTKNVHYDEKIKKNNDFLYVGRANDPIKRFHLVYDSLKKLEDSQRTLLVCGQQDPKFGKYLGYVSDEQLNELYNSTKYVFLPSKNEGIGLSMIESLICGSIPIACSDNETAKEFLPKDFICEPDSDSIVNQIKLNDNNYDKKRKLALELGSKYKEKFSKTNIAKNILNVKK